MQLTKRQTAHILAALRWSQGEDLSGMPHFDEKMMPLTEEEIDELCEKLNLPDDEPSNPRKQ